MVQIHCRRRCPSRYYNIKLGINRVEQYYRMTKPG